MKVVCEQKWRTLQTMLISWFGQNYDFTNGVLMFELNWHLALVSARRKHPRASVNARHEPREVSSALHPEGADEEVEDRGDENHGRC